MVSLERTCHIRIPNEKTSQAVVGKVFFRSSGAINPGVPLTNEIFLAKETVSLLNTSRSRELPKSASLQTPCEETY